MHTSKSTRNAILILVLLLLSGLALPILVSSQEETPVVPVQTDVVAPIPPEMVDRLLATYAEVLAASKQSMEQTNKTYTIFSGFITLIFGVVAGASAYSIFSAKSAVEKMSRSVDLLERAASSSGALLEKTVQQATDVTDASLKHLEAANTTIDSMTRAGQALSHIEDVKARYEKIQERQQDLDSRIARMNSDLNYAGRYIAASLFPSELWQRVCSLWSEDDATSIGAVRGLGSLLDREWPMERHQVAIALAEWGERADRISDKA